jgi:hypothetical protein
MDPDRWVTADAHQKTREGRLSRAGDGKEDARPDAAGNIERIDVDKNATAPFITLQEQTGQLTGHR